MSRADRVLSTPPIPAAARWVTRHRLRVLALHDVADLPAFEHQLRQLLEWFVPVDSARVLEWYRADRALPDRALWVTFDDGDPTTIIDAAPVLERLGVPATAFVCPGLIESGRAPWWEVVLRATARGRHVELGGVRLQGQPAVTALKGVPDHERRGVVASLADEVGGLAERPVEVEDLQRWRDAGCDLGNHTWDHPCLDRCTPQEQLDQIDRAAAWLDDRALWQRRLFAYPNGDRTELAEAHLARRGYDLVALFDHHVVAHAAGPLKVSRLRLDAAASATRTAAVSSGVHSGLFGLRDAARLSRRRG
jgi:peptidoglycan/xylan/chitin deacetylase (PgdA/CDA1 family)